MLLSCVLGSCDAPKRLELESPAYPVTLSADEMGDAGPPDAGPPDAGPPDAGPPDAGPPDAGPLDAGPLDSGPPDSGPPFVRDGGVLRTAIGVTNWSRSLPAGSAAYVTDDLTGDGANDLVISTPFPQSRLSVFPGPLLQDGGLRPLWAEFLMSSTNIRLATTAQALDLVGTASHDLVVSDEFSSHLYVFPGPLQQGTFSETAATIVLDGGNGSGVAALLGRRVLSGRLLPDAGRAVVISAGGEPETFCVGGDGPFVLPLPLSQSGHVQQLARHRITGWQSAGECPGQYSGLADLSGDGFDDLVVTSALRGVFVFFGPLRGATDRLADNADAVIQARPSGDALGESPLALSDVNGDGTLDVVMPGWWPRPLIFHGPFGPGVVSVDAGMPFEPWPGHPAALLVSSGPDADFDGDGRDDLFFVDTEIRFGGVRVVSMSDAGVRELALFEAFDTVRYVTVGDITGDGRAEVLLVLPAGQSVQLIVVSHRP